MSKSFKISIVILIITGVAVYLLKWVVLAPISNHLYLDSIGHEVGKTAGKNLLLAGHVDTTKKEPTDTSTPEDSLVLYFISENNFVQIMGEDDMPVITFSLPEGEPLTEQVLTANSLVVDYIIGGTQSMFRQFKFTLRRNPCASTGKGIYQEWTNATFSNIHFTKGAGQATDRGLFQSKLYWFEQTGYCFTFEVTYSFTNDAATVTTLPTYNEHEEINFIENVLESIKIY